VRTEQANDLAAHIYTALANNVDQRLTAELATGMYHTIKAKIDALTEADPAPKKATKKATTNGKHNRTAGATHPAN
jgi:hypothetical protein